MNFLSLSFSFSLSLSVYFLFLSYFILSSSFILFGSFLSILVFIHYHLHHHPPHQPVFKCFNIGFTLTVSSMSTAKERLTAISGHVNCNSKSYGSSSQTSPELESPQPLIKSPSSSSSLLSSHSIATNNSIQLEKSKPIPGKDTNENGSLPYKRHKLLKWNGWGYKDSGFTVDPNCHDITFTGDRYKIGNRKLPLFKKWVESTLSVDLSNKLTSQCQPDIENIAKPIINESFMKDVKFINIKTSFDPEDRLFRSHGHCLHEIFKLREKGTLERIPDLVVWPRNHDDVVKLVRVADKNDVVIIPYGGGTSVSGALECPINEKRMIVSLDTSKMNKILWIDHINLTAHAEAGIIGQDLEAQLAKYNLCTGHEPDSFEFSSLGGWVATRASGMKKNVYGNIEDLLIHVRMVSSIGTIEKNCNVPRISSGPDIHHIILGSEGTLGVITEVTLKVRPLPECKRYNSIVFPCFEDGYKFMREVARQRLKPASVRLMDNQQFIFGQALKPEADSIWISMKNFFKKLYITKLKGFRVDEMCVATILMEGTIEEVETLENKLLDISASNNGLAAGEENGKTGYMLTFVIAYIRDIGLDYGVVAESFETSVPWDRCLDVCNNVKDCITRQVKKYGIKKPALITCRITQTYDCGACVYFYFAFNYLEGVTGDPVDIYHAIENAARDEIIACGGSISHHHGVGKVRKKWLRETVSDTGLGVMKAIKNYVDPNNVFANGNLMS